MMHSIRHQLYSPYERMWHWLQAAGIGMLMLTGLVIHWPAQLGGFPFAWAVQIHNVLGFLLVANAFLGLFYYLTTGTIRQYLPRPHDFTTLAVRLVWYYIRGMFQGQSHPLEKSPSRRLNPLQQITYLVILNVLLPAQITTGVLMWGAQRWPQAVSSVGGLAGLGMIHTLGAWLFASFVVMHVYLITTGHKPWTYLQAMVLGYEDICVEGNADGSVA